MSEKVTVEYYGDSLLVKLIGAVDVPAKRIGASRKKSLLDGWTAGDAVANLGTTSL